MPHYYDAQQQTPSKPFRVAVRMRGQSVSLWSDAGVFSKDALDAGTSLLIETCALAPGWRVHDLGCGIGVVGIAVKRAEPSCRVVCSDVSARAVETARKNVAELGLAIDVVQSDGYAEIPQLFDTVLFNPPYVAGRETIYRLMQEAKDHLAGGGTLQVVARHTKGGATLKARMWELFGNCDDSRRGRGYRVYVGKKT